jgi:hypothetical protein
MAIPDVKFNHCVVTIIVDGMGKMLFIKRKEGIWSLCAGHIESGETPEQAAKREIYEETGLVPEYLSIIHKHDNPSLFFFSAQCQGMPHSRNDPDNEGVVQWVDVTRGIPANIYNNLAGPKGENNVLRQLFNKAGLRKSEFDWLDECCFLDLSKGAMQRLYPFDPQKEKQKEIQDLPSLKTDLKEVYYAWAERSLPSYREKLGNNLSQEVKQRGLQKLHGLTQVRRNPVTNEREFLLHRAHNINECNDPLFYENKINHSSWSPDIDNAKFFHSLIDRKAGKISSAWIPESSIRGYLPILGDPGSEKGPPRDTQRNEKEVIVAPGKYELNKE